MAASNGERETLINTIDNTFKEGLPFFENVANEYPDLKVGEWGAREVLCHVVFFHEVAVIGWEAIRRGGPPYTFNVVLDELNARAVARLEGVTVPQLAAEIRRLHALYLKEARLAPDLDAVGVVRWDDSTSTVRQRLVSNNRHFEDHIREWTELVEGKIQGSDKPHV